MAVDDYFSLSFAFYTLNAFISSAFNWRKEVLNSACISISRTFFFLFMCLLQERMTKFHFKLFKKFWPCRFSFFAIYSRISFNFSYLFTGKRAICFQTLLSCFIHPIFKLHFCNIKIFKANKTSKRLVMES